MDELAAIKAAATMGIEEAFAKYGYVRDIDGTWLQGRGEGQFDLAKSERWLQTNGGFLMFRPPRLGFGAEVPFGWPVASIVLGTVPQIITGVEDGRPVRVDAPSSLVGIVQVPAGTAAGYEGVSGLHPASHPEAFRWLWDQAEIAYLYQFAEEGWLKVQDYAAGGVPSGWHMERAPAAEVPSEAPAP